MKIHFFKKKKHIYLDYASLTPVLEGVFSVMKRYSSPEYANPSSLHRSGVSAARALLDAQKRVAHLIHAHADEILFTSGGTESNHLLLNSFKPEECLVSAFEHSSIIHHAPMKKIPLLPTGAVDMEELKKLITPDIKLVSVMMVNNEVGTIEDIASIAKALRHIRKERGSVYPYFHTDASQAPVYTEIDIEKLGVDFMTLDSHKVYGPRGVGMLYVKRNTRELKRGGTENLPGIMGFVYALEKVSEMRAEETVRIQKLRTVFTEGLREIYPHMTVNGGVTSPHIIHVSLPGVDNEYMVFQLDARGIECSTKSACLKDTDESYVAHALGIDSKTSIRFSLGMYTTLSDIHYVLKVLREMKKGAH